MVRISKTFGHGFEKLDGEKMVYPKTQSLAPVPKITLEDLTVSEPATKEKILEKLEIYGGAVVKNYLSEEDIDKVYAEVKPTLDQDRAWDGEFFPPETRRCTATSSKSRTAAEKLLNHPLNTAVSHEVLGKENVFWIGEKLSYGYSPPQYNSFITFRIGPGAKDQVLHRDDILHHNIHTHADKYEYGRDTALGSCIALTRTTKANGATRFIPTSHLWDHQRKPKEEECVYAELDKGDCFFMLASCYHAGSANTTKDEYRTVSILFMTQGTLRQEENIFLSTEMDYFKSLSADTLKLMGWTVSQPFCGFVGLKDPLPIVKPEYKADKDDIYDASYVPVPAED